MGHENEKLQVKKMNIDNNKWVYRPAEKEAEDDCQAPDFQEVLSAPPGAHFQFSDERNWSKELDEEAYTSKSLFTLDVPIIMENIAKLPFYIRADMDKSLFTDSEISKMDKGYRQLASSQPDFSTENVKPSTRSTPAPQNNSCQTMDLSEQSQSNQVLCVVKSNTPPKIQSSPHASSQRPSNIGPTNSHLPDLRQTNQTPSNPHLSNPGSTKKTEDLQDWLDDMINDKA